MLSWCNIFGKDAVKALDYRDWKDDHSLDVNSKAIYTITAAPSVEDANRVKEIGSKKIEEDIEKDFKDFSEKNNVLQNLIVTGKQIGRAHV